MLRLLHLVLIKVLARPRPFELRVFYLPGPRTTRHFFILCWRVLTGVSQPCRAKISAWSVAFFRFRMELGPNWQIFRLVTMSPGQRFTTQSSNCSLGEDLRPAGGMIGCGPLRTISGSSDRSFSGITPAPCPVAVSVGGRPSLSRSNRSTTVVIPRFVWNYPGRRFLRCGGVVVRVDGDRLVIFFDHGLAVDVGP